MKYVTRVCTAARDEDEFPIKMLLMCPAVYSRLVDTKEKIVRIPIDYRKFKSYTLKIPMRIYIYSIYIVEYDIRIVRDDRHVIFNYNWHTCK